jgi:hypothetical protein
MYYAVTIANGVDADVVATWITTSGLTQELEDLR